MPFTIPNLNRVAAPRLALSSVVLGARRVPLADALYSAGKDKGAKAQTFSPLVQDGHKLIPSVTRVFRRSKELYVYAEAYQQEVDPAHPLLAFVTLYQDGRKVLETAPVEVADAASHRLRTMGFRLSVPLNALSDGEHLAQVTVLDATGQKAAFWQSAVMLVP